MRRKWTSWDKDLLGQIKVQIIHQRLLTLISTRYWRDTNSWNIPRTSIWSRSWLTSWSHSSNTNTSPFLKSIHSWQKCCFLLGGYKSCRTEKKYREFTHISSSFSLAVSNCTIGIISGLPRKQKPLDPKQSSLASKDPFKRKLGNSRACSSSQSKIIK